MNRVRPLLLTLACTSFLVPAVAAGPQDSAPAVDAGQPATHPTRMVHKRLGVVASNDDWARTGLLVERGDVVVLFAHGTVRVSEHAKPVEADGNFSGAGRLEAKVGSNPGFPVGKSYAFQCTDRGILKLRVSDSRHDDNTGGYEVKVILIPSETIPDPTPVDESEK